MAESYKVKTTFQIVSVKLTVGDQEADASHVEPVGGAVGAGIPANSLV